MTKFEGRTYDVWYDMRVRSWTVTELCSRHGQVIGDTFHDTVKPEAIRAARLAGPAHECHVCEDVLPGAGQ